MLVSAYFVDQLNQMYNFNMFNYKSLVHDKAQNIIETISELGISFFSIYILFNFNLQDAIIKFVLILFSIFYFIDGTCSLLIALNINDTGNSIRNFNKEIFYIEYLITKICTICLFYILYSTLF